MSDSLTQIKAVLGTAPARWTALAESMPAELFARRPAPGEWSALECLQHVIVTERRVMPLRVRCFLAGQDFPGFNPDAPGNAPAAATDAQSLAREFSGLRAATMEMMATVQPADMARRVRHQELGPVTLSEQLNEWAAHDLMHIVQAEQALMQPFIAQSGPWRVYFAAHEAKQQK
jgi:hypothetical protein